MAWACLEGGECSPGLQTSVPKPLWMGSVQRAGAAPTSPGLHLCCLSGAAPTCNPFGGGISRGPLLEGSRAWGGIPLLPQPGLKILTETPGEVAEQRWCLFSLLQENVRGGSAGKC